MNEVHHDNRDKHERSVAIIVCTLIQIGAVVIITLLFLKLI